MTKRMLSICLAFVLLLGTLAGCSKNKTKTDNSSQNTQQETIPELASQYAYQPQYFDLPEPIQWISRSCVSGSTLYFTASILSGQDTYIDKDGNEVSYDTYSEGLFRFDPDSGECVQLVNYVDKPDVEDLDDGTQIFRSSNSSTPSSAVRRTYLYFLMPCSAFCTGDAFTSVRSIADSPLQCQAPVRCTRRAPRCFLRTV